VCLLLCNSDTGLIGVYYVTELDKIMEAQWAMMREFQNLVHNASDEKVEIAKTQVCVSASAFYTGTFDNTCHTHIITVERVPSTWLWA
jgi:hypothetical protein